MNKKLSLFTVLLAGTFLTSSTRAADYGITINDFNTPGISWQEFDNIPQPPTDFSGLVDLQDIKDQRHFFVATLDDEPEEYSSDKVYVYQLDPGSNNVNIVNNYGNMSQGAAVENQGDAPDLKLNVNVFNNGATGYGGFLYNKYQDQRSVDVAHIDEIKGNIVNNLAPNGGAIYNEWNGFINKISGNFIGNGATYVDYLVRWASAAAPDSDISAYGGFLHNRGIINEINGQMIGNFAEGQNANGGAVYNFENLGNELYSMAYNLRNEKGEIVKTIYRVNRRDGYYTEDEIKDKSYHIVDLGLSDNEWIGDYNEDGVIDKEDADYYIEEYMPFDEYMEKDPSQYSGELATAISGDIIGNYAKATEYAQGGAIYNEFSISEIKPGTAKGNYAIGNYAAGGFLANEYGLIGNLSGKFEGNFVIGNYQYEDTDPVENTPSSSEFIENIHALGGAIMNASGVMNITDSEFNGNYAAAQDSAAGGAVLNYIFLNRNTI